MQAKQSALAKQVMNQSRNISQATIAAQTPSPPHDGLDKPPPGGTRAPPANNSAMATALRSLNDLHNQFALRDKANLPDGTPPYPRSLASTAPSSPRM